MCKEMYCCECGKVCEALTLSEPESSEFWGMVEHTNVSYYVSECCNSENVLTLEEADEIGDNHLPEDLY